MEDRPGAIIAQMHSEMFMHSHGIHQCLVELTRLLEVVQHGARMVGRPGSGLILVVTAITPGAWRLIPTTPIAGLSRPVLDRARRITREVTRKPISIAGVVTVPGRPL